MSEGQGEVMGEGRKGKIWSFLEEKTRVSNEERALAVGSKAVPQQQTPAPVPAAPVPAAPVPAFQLLPFQLLLCSSEVDTE
jgi:hypothetical protein